MKRKYNLKWKMTLLIVGTALTFGALSCKKEDTDPQISSSFPVPNYPQPEDADAVLVAVKAATPFAMQMPKIPGMPEGSTEINIEYGLGIAQFKGKVQAGSVKLNGTDLKFVNGVHLWQPDFSDLSNPSSITGINLNGNIQWNVTNPNIERTLSGLPGMPKINSGKTVTKASGYTVTNAAISGAQYVLYGVYSSNGKYVLKEKAGNSTSITFSASELAELGSTKNGIIQANAYTISDQVLEGKKVYFVRQSSYSLTGVEIN